MEDITQTQKDRLLTDCISSYPSSARDVIEADYYIVQGANINQQAIKTGRTPLIEAISKLDVNKLKIAQLLLNHDSINIYLQTYFGGDTAIDIFKRELKGLIRENGLLRCYRCWCAPCVKLEKIQILREFKNIQSILQAKFKSISYEVDDLIMNICSQEKTKHEIYY